jgi:hypothetical protein
MFMKMITGLMALLTIALAGLVVLSFLSYGLQGV